MENKNTLTLGSLFDGSGGFPLGGLLCGITPVWASEIEPFPIRVTTKRLPFMKHYGDVSSLDGAALPLVDIITFGSPCQDMSIAGKRSGLNEERSGLFHQAVRIVKEMRCATNGRYPRYLVWENVPRAFSSNQGEDFKAVLESICGIKGGETDIPRPAKWPNAGEIVADDLSIAWRVLDTQYCGVPQHRKRIFLVADLTGNSAGKILFESEGVSGYSAEGFRSWQRTAGNAPHCLRESGGVCLNDQSGRRIDVTEDVTATLRIEAHHPPCVMESAGFCTEHSEHSRSIGYEEERSPTLRAGVVPAAVYENHSQDTRCTELSDIAPTVSSTYGTGGNNQPFVVENAECFDVRFTSEGTRNARQNCYKTDISRTLDTGGNAPDSNQGGVSVVYGICSKDSNSMKSDNPHSGFYNAETARTLDGNGGNPSCNQGGMAVVESCVLQGSMIGREDKNGPQGSGVDENVSFTLNTTDRHAVAYSTSKNSHYTIASGDLANSLVASDYKDPPTVTYGISRDNHFSVSENTQPSMVAKGPGTVQCGYTSRRLTPIECARLQGFPDWWCADLAIDDSTEEDIAFWREVFEIHRKIMGTSSKPKTDKQIIKWLKEPYPDAAEYKMWGNGVALPCVYFVLAGIAWANKKEKTG